MTTFLTGLQHAGKELRDLVKKLRNPFQYPTLMFSTAWRRYKNTRGDPPMTLGLSHYLHPSLEDAAKRLERTVHRLAYGTEALLQKHGAKVTEPKNQLELKRIADVMIDVYAMTAVLGRASRSYCIGLREAQTEVNQVENQTFSESYAKFLLLPFRSCWLNFLW